MFIRYISLGVVEDIRAHNNSPIAEGSYSKKDTQGAARNTPSMGNSHQQFHHQTTLSSLSPQAVSIRQY